MQIARFLVLAALLPAVPGFAEQATERYAGAQLRVAQQELDRAVALVLRGKTGDARRLAAQAALDAWLAWGMTDSAYLRREAAEIYQTASSLKEEP
jgi:Domain of unknown function (DUF4398)